MNVEKYLCVKGCGNFIIFTSTDEKFFRKLGFVDKITGKVNRPKLCRSCKLKQKQQRDGFKKPISYR